MIDFHAMLNFLSFISGLCFLFILLLFFYGEVEVRKQEISDLKRIAEILDEQIFRLEQRMIRADRKSQKIIKEANNLLDSRK